MRKCRRRDAEFGAHLANHEAVRMSGEQKPDDAQPGLGPKGSEHIGVAGGILGVAFEH
jgi:hypothetical protein